MNSKKTVRIIISLAILGFVILVHESGHFALCKLFHITTPTFSIGFGPALVQKKIGDTTFQIALIPLGGYVSMNAAELNKAPYWQKMLITLAGIFNNFLLALIIMGILFYKNRTRFKPIIEKIVNGSPAAKAGFQVGDRCITLDGTSINNDASRLLHAIQINPGHELICTIERNGMLYELPVHIGTQTIAGATIGYLGIMLEKDYSKTLTIPEIIYQAMTTTWSMMKKSFSFLATFLKPEARQRYTGPIGIVSLAAQNLQQGSTFFLFFIASISIELGVFNVLPIPLLDGGQAFYYTIEAIIGHPLSSGELTLIHFMYLILLIVLVIYLNRKAQSNKKTNYPS